MEVEMMMTWGDIIDDRDDDLEDDDEIDGVEDGTMIEEPELNMGIKLKVERSCNETDGFY